MTFVTTYTFRDSEHIFYSSTKEEAIALWNAGKKNPDVACVSGGILCAFVELGRGTYLYFANKKYRKGTIVKVPTKYGEARGRVSETRVFTRQNLERYAEKHGFKMEDYKEILQGQER